MNLYLDASVLIPLFVEEARTRDAHDGLAGATPFVSDFAAAEFSSGIARRVRLGDINESEVQSVFQNAWTAKAAARAPLESGHMLSATILVRRLDLGLRAPDAVNIALAQRLQAALFTFDAKMAAAARLLGLDVRG